MNIFCCWICSANNSRKYICIYQLEDVCGAQCKKLKLQFFLIWHFVQVCPICRGPIFQAQFARARFVGAQFAAPTFSRGPTFRGTICRGPNCHATKKWGAQFAAKSARGPICLEPLETEGSLLNCDEVTRGLVAAGT